MLRMFFGLAAAGIFSVVIASASALTINGHTLQSGMDSNLNCDADGVHLAWSVNAGDGVNVTGVTISGIDASCVGETLFFDTPVTTPLTGTIAGSTHSFTFPSGVMADSISQVTVTIYTSPS